MGRTKSAKINQPLVTLSKFYSDNLSYSNKPSATPDRHNQSLLDPSSELSLRPLPLDLRSLPPPPPSFPPPPLSLLSLRAFMERRAFSRSFFSRASVSIFSSSDEDLDLFLCFLDFLLFLCFLCFFLALPLRFLVLLIRFLRVVGIVVPAAL